jgi:ABC-type glycerol-3-phosphate transport system substrate-binding protein
MLIAATLSAACAGKGMPAAVGEPVVITFACKNYQRSRYEDLVKGFQTANPDVRVQFVSADEASGMQGKGGTVTVDGREIERLTAAADTFVWYARLRPTDWSYLLNLQPFVDDSSSSFPADDLYPGTLDHFRWQGGLYGLPARVLPILIFYDKGMFDEASVPHPRTGWTWDDFLEAAARLTEREEDAVKRYGFVDSHFYNTLLAMMHQHEVPLWDDRTDPPRPLFDTPEVAGVLRRYTDLALSYGVMPVPEVGSNVMASNLVNEGKAAMWTDFASDLDYHGRRTDLGLAPFPEDVAAANPYSVYGFFASAGTAHPEAAWRWLSYLSANYQPLLDGSLPGRRSVGEQLPWWRRLDEETKAVFEYALAHAPTPDNPLNVPLLVAVIGVFEGRASVEEALVTAQSRALELQAELAAATPPAPQPVSAPQPTPAEGQTVITFAPAPGADTSLYHKLAASFHESHPDVWVDVVPDPANLVELGTASDCFGGPLLAQSYEMRQQIRSLQPLLEADASFDLADYYPQFLEPLQQDGELWGLPYGADALMVYCNRQRFAEAGGTLPGPGWSFDDFLDAAVALSDDGQYGFTTREGAYGDLLFVLERMGARLFDSSGELPTPTFDDPTVVAALGRYADLSRRQPLSPATPSTQSGWPHSVVMGGHPAGVRTGQVAMWIDYIGYHAFAPPLSFETGVAPLPVGAQASTEFSVRAYYVSIHAAAPQACWEWLTFLSSRPEAVQLLPSRRSVAASPIWQSQVGEGALPAYQATLEYDDASIFRLRREIPWLAYACPWLDEAFRAAVAGEEVARALDEAQRKAAAYVLCLESKEGFADGEAQKACAREVDPNYQGFGEVSK